MSVIELPKLFADCLSDALDSWIETNKQNVDEKWLKFIIREHRKFRKKPKTVAGVMGFALWTFNALAQLGVMAGLGPSQVSLHYMPERLDRKSTLRLLHLCAATLSLQFLPRKVKAVD